MDSSDYSDWEGFDDTPDWEDFDDPVITEDFTSLYPSVMIEDNLLDNLLYDLLTEEQTKNFEPEDYPTRENLDERHCDECRVTDSAALIKCGGCESSYCENCISYAVTTSGMSCRACRERTDQEVEKA